MSQTKVKRELIDGSLGTDWQSAPKTTDFTAVVGQGYFVDTSSNVVVVSLPAGTSGDEIHFTDYAGTFDTNKIKFVASSSPSQQKIQGGTDPAKNTTENAFVKLVYQNDTKGWTAFNLTSDPNVVTPVYYLVVAGGGGTRSDGPGGGGAGGYLTNYGGTAITLTPSSNYSISVGPGGASGVNGTDSHFTGTGASFTSDGGGRGGGYPGGTNNVLYNGGAGGSGGGGAGGQYSAAGGSATTGQGNAGGSSGACCGTNYGGGGGGGAGAVGASVANSGSAAGAGGVGLANLILSVANAQSAVVGEVSGGTVYYAGGGGGSGASSHGAGGTGGGATGTTGANAGTPNTGGGGAGSNATGGSGVVILRYPSDRTITNPGGGLVFSTYQETTTTTNDTNVTVFKSGTGNIQFG